MERIYWTGYCKQDRLIVIGDIVRIININGCIASTNMFSDLSISFIIESTTEKLSPLYESLNGIIEVAESRPVNASFVKDVIILLSVNFTQGTGNLKNEVPAVPG